MIKKKANKRYSDGNKPLIVLLARGWYTKVEKKSATTTAKYKKIKNKPYASHAKANDKSRRYLNSCNNHCGYLPT